MVKKTYYYQPKQAKLVERLAKKLKVTESWVVRELTDIMPEPLLLQALKNKKESND